MATNGNRKDNKQELYNNGKNIDNFNNERLRTKEETKAGVENLRTSTIESSLSTASTKSDLTVEKTGLKYEKDIHSLEGFLSAIDKLLQEIENIKPGTSKKGLSKAGKKTMDIAKDKLKQYEKTLKKKKEKLVKEKNAEINESDITILQNIFTQLNHLKEDIHKGQFGEYSNTASYLYNSPENAKKSNKRQANNLKFNQKFQEELKEGAIVNIFNKNTQQANHFLRRIAQGEYRAADYQLFITNSGVLVPYCQRYRIPIPTNPRGTIGGRTVGGAERRIGGVERTPQRSVDYSNMDLGEAFQQGGLVGLFEKGLGLCKNMTPLQKNTWKSLAVLGGYAAGIYGLYKFFTNKKMSFWGKALTTGGVIFASQALTGENPITLFKRLLTGGFTKEYLEDKFGNLFGDAVSGVGNSGIESSNTITPAMYSMMIFQPSATTGEIRKMTSRFKNDKENNEWKIFRKGAIDKLKSKYGRNCAEYFSATFSDNFDEQKRTNRLASFGVTDSAADKTKIYELANNASTNEIILEKFKEENGLKVNPDKKKELDEYMNNLRKNNQAINIAVLNSHSDWFKTDLEATYTDREKDRENIKSLENQVEALSIDPQKKAELKTAIKRFYDERTINSKPELSDFSLKIDNGFLILTSHKGHETKINLNEKEINGFGKENKFTDLSDLLNTADISNKILETQKGKIPKDMPPFEYKILGKKGRGIYFNDADFSLSSFLSLDTRVLSGGRGGKMGEIEAISKRPEDYADYLSKRWIDENKINIDSTLYPTVKKLSDEGIVFTNQQEIKDLEDWLKQIKENLKFTVSTPDGNPFSITLTDKLEFKAVNGDTKDFPEDISKKFPTLLRTGNKEKFLKMMNDTSNKMRGGVHK